MNLLSGRDYETSNGGWTKFQAILAGGTATLSAKSTTASAYSTIKVLDEGWVDVDLPSASQYKVVLTGSAAVTTEGMG